MSRVIGRGKGKEQRIGRRKVGDGKNDKQDCLTSNILVELGGIGLLGTVWPKERVVVGLRVNRWMHRELLDHVEQVLLVGRGRKKLRAERVAKDLSRFYKNKIISHWTSHGAMQSTGPFLEGMAAAAANGNFGPGLVHLDIAGNTLVSKTACLAEVLKFGAQLRFFDLSHAGLRFDHHSAEYQGLIPVMEALKACKELTHLDFSGNRLASEGARRLAEALEQSQCLTHLSIGNAMIEGGGVRHLARSLRNTTTLTCLSLRSNVHLTESGGLRSIPPILARILRCPGLTPMTLLLGALADWLRHAPHLAHFDFWGNQFPEDPTETLPAGLRHCYSLTHLDMGSNHLCPAGVRALSSVLGQCSALARLDLNSNAMEPDGAGALAQVLPECRALTHLDLANNFIQNRGADQLASVLPRCRSLTRLDLRTNRISSEGALSLATALGDCTSLSLLDVRHNILHGLAVCALVENDAGCTVLVTAHG